MFFFFFLLRVFLIIFFFFFSTRRRHTRLQGDRSSDVCSSDLAIMAFGTRPALARVRVNGASTTRFGKRQSPTTRGSSKVGIEVPRSPKSSWRTCRAGLRSSNAPRDSRPANRYRRSLPTLHAR